MASAVSALYAPLIERELNAIPAAIQTFRKDHSWHDLFLAVGRFAVLAFAPTQHAKHALLAVLSAYDLREENQSDALLCECAIYLAQSRLPWSEPPLLDPPPIDRTQRKDDDELREAIAARDRGRGERWLAARLADENLAHTLLSLASEDLEDLGHKLIVANAAVRLAGILGEKGRFAALRVAIWEMVAYGGKRPPDGPVMETAELLDRLLRGCIADQGSLVSAHSVFLLDAALQTEEEDVLQHAARHLTIVVPSEGVNLGGGAFPLPDSSPSTRLGMTYRLGRDYGQYLKAQAVARRLRGRFPKAPLDSFVAACHYNLENAPSFEEWSFA